LTSLQEKLSVCYAKEAEQEDVVAHLKSQLQTSMSKSKRIEPMQKKIDSLNEELSSKTKEVEKTLQESARLKKLYLSELNKKKEEINSIKTKNNGLTESFNSAKKDLDELKKSSNDKVNELENTLYVLKK
jgi:uncharacterized coiled-coil DUF342 family protein